jgi:hypothetical protein
LQKNITFCLSTGLSDLKVYEDLSSAFEAMEALAGVQTRRSVGSTAPILTMRRSAYHSGIDWALSLIYVRMPILSVCETVNFRYTELVLTPSVRNLKKTCVLAERCCKTREAAFKRNASTFVHGRSPR